MGRRKGFGRGSSYGALADKGNEHDRAFPRRNHARGLLISRPPKMQRAQGRPGADWRLRPAC